MKVEPRNAERIESNLRVRSKAGRILLAAPQGQPAAGRFRQLRRLILALKHHIEAEKKFTRKESQNAPLEKIAVAAASLTSAAESIIEEFKKHEVRRLCTDDRALRQSLKVIARLSRRSDYVGSWAKMMREKDPGKHAIEPEAGSVPDSRQLCALIGALVFENLKGIWPGKHTQALHICERIWRMAGADRRRFPNVPPGVGGTASSGNDSVEVWKRYLKEAKVFLPPAPVGAATVGAYIASIFSAPVRPRSSKTQDTSILYDGPAEKWLTRVEAVDYLTRKGRPITEADLILMSQAAKADASGAPAITNAFAAMFNRSLDRKGSGPLIVKSLKGAEGETYRAEDLDSWLRNSDDPKGV
jgi:hypothetical protein